MASITSATSSMQHEDLTIRWARAGNFSLFFSHGYPHTGSGYGKVIQKASWSFVLPIHVDILSCSPNGDE